MIYSDENLDLKSLGFDRDPQKEWIVEGSLI